MRKFMGSAIVPAALAIVAALTCAPASFAAEGPTSGSTQPPTISGVGTATNLWPDEAWVHFRPTLNSEHLAVLRKNQVGDIATICWIWSEGERWDLIFDRPVRRAGYTWSKSLVHKSEQHCSTAGQGPKSVITDTWAHLTPISNWAHEVVSPGHDIAALCTLGVRYDPSDGSYRRWDLILDHNNNVAGFTWYSAIRESYTIGDC